MNKNDKQQIFSKIPQKETLKKGDVVYGTVVQTTPKVAIIEIDSTNKTKVLSPTSTGILFINNISSSYVEKVSDLIRRNDIVIAKVTEQDKFGFKLTVDEPNLGVIKANCYKCKEPLNLKSKVIKCLKCKTEQERKVGKV